MSLQIKNIKINTDNKEIVKGLNLEVKKGEVHVIMGPNGSGKSTLANTLMGHPKYEVMAGSIILDNKDITEASPDERAKAGLFLSMQYPPEIAGVTISNFLRLAVEAKTGKKQNPIEFYKNLQEKITSLGMDPSFANRYVNTGFSGGEKKRAETLQLAILNPKYAILDETDSGLDVDALKAVADGINNFHSKENGIILITHYNRILEYIKPNFVHIMVDGNIVKTGTKELAKEIETNGYDKWIS